MSGRFSAVLGEAEGHDVRGGVRRFYWELVRHRTSGGAARPSALLAQPAVIAALATLRRLAGDRALRVACLVELPPPDDAPARAGIVRELVAARDALSAVDVGIDVWPQLAEGARYLNARSAAAFAARLWPVVDEVPGVGLALDVEPAVDVLEGAWRLAHLPRAAAALVRTIARSSMTDLVALRDDARDRGLAVHAATMPPILPALVRARLLGCPDVDDDGVPLFGGRGGGAQAAMCYAPMLARFGAPRVVQRAAFVRWAARHRRRHDGIVLGPLSTGILGDEPVYASLDDVVADLDVARGLGFDDVAFFSLEGLLYGRDGMPGDDGAPRRGDWERWGEALLAR